MNIGRNTSDVSNGDIGTISSIEKNEGYEITVDYGNQNVITYYESEFDYLTLAYAITIHKSQGSEYKFCCIAWPSELLENSRTRAMIYTAVTRCKEKCVIVGNVDTVCESIINGDSMELRRTKLSHWIRSLNM